MTSNATTIAEYFDLLPADRVAPMEQLWQTIETHLAPGFSPAFQYRMPSFVVNHDRYPAGYHCDPKQALPFLSIASQKNFVALYHMGIYAEPDLMAWFTAEYPKHMPTKLDMGKSCIRFKKPDRIPFDLIGELVGKMDADTWIALYEANLKR